MAITRQKPNTVLLGGAPIEVGDVPVSEAVTPGQLVELFDSGSGVGKYKKHSLTSKEGNSYALDQPELNKDCDTAYAVGDLARVAVCPAGTKIWAFIASGQNIAVGNALESAGNGTLKVYSSGIKIAVALESVDNSGANGVNGDARIRVEVL